jgi:hypothetical protein
MTRHVDLGELIRGALTVHPVAITMPKNVRGTKVFPLSPPDFEEAVKLMIAYFCRHPRRILDAIQRSGCRGIEETVVNLFSQTLGISNKGKECPDLRVWHGTVGEVLATAYVMGFTKYKVPVFKLRLAPNRRFAMHGDDLLGFQFTSKGEPLSLLVGEAKNWEDAHGAVKKANATLLKVKETSPTLLDFVVEVLNSEDRVAEARMVERFLDSYDYRYKTEYLAFLVADRKKWKDRSYLNLDSNPATPLEIATILVGDRDAFHKSLILTEKKESKARPTTATTINDLEDAQKLLRNLDFKSHHSKLASAALATDLQIEGREKIQYGLEPKRLAQMESAARLLSLIGIRLPLSEHDQKETLLLYAARIFERLAIWELEHEELEDAADAMIDAAIIYGVAGYDANARVLMDGMYKIQAANMAKLTPSYQFTVLFLSGRLPELEDKVAELVLETKQFATDKSQTEDEWADSVGQSLAQVADLLVARSLGLLLHDLRVGRNELVNSAVDSLQHSASVYSMVGEYKSSHLSTILTAYSARLLQDSPHVLLPAYINGATNG